jgi:hypothetical protein
VEGDQHLSDNVEGGGVTVRTGEVLPQRDYRHQADEASDDDRRLDRARRDVAERDGFVYPLEDWKEDDRGSDVGDR